LNLSSAPIGVFDSGLGGLTVLRALQQQLPHEHFLYFADTRFLPYGDRSEEFLRERGLTIANHFAKLGAKAIVVACNTATAAAAESIRAHCLIPVVALEPAVKPAAALSKTGTIAVLATTRTLASQRFKRLVEDHAEHLKVISQPCPGLADAIESDGPNSPLVANLLDTFVTPLRHTETDVVVLGCTHYPWVSEGIAARLPANVTILDTGEAIARQLHRRLANTPSLMTHPQNHISLATSGDVEKVQKTVEMLWGVKLPVEHWAL
jgi:glutamate racemase